MRYDGEDRVWAPYRKAGESVQIVMRPPTIWTNQQYVTYLATSTDDMMSLAFARYGTPEAYWVIADMNPTIVCPDDLQAGQVIRVPLLS
jgi:hypothetical protein